MQPWVNDLSYEEALLDLEIRSFIQAEYAGAEPPPDVLPQLLRAIYFYREEVRAQESQNRLSTQRLQPALWQLTRGLASILNNARRADTSRIISGAMVTVLLMLVTWPSMTHILNGRTGGISLNDGSSVSLTSSTPVATTDLAATTALPSVPRLISPGLLYEQPRFLLEQKTGEDLGASSYLQASSPQTEPVHKHPPLGQEFGCTQKANAQCN